MAGWIALLLAVGCGVDGDAVPPDADTDADTDADSDADTDTDTDTVVQNLVASCTVSVDNGLRGTCAATFETPHTLEVTLSLDGEAPLVFTAAAPGTGVELPFWGLVPGTAWQWAATAVEDRSLVASGEVVAGPVAGTLAALSVFVDAAGTHGDEFMIFNYGCFTLEEALIVIDRLGRIRWYQEARLAPLEPPALSFRSFNVSPEGDVLALLERGHVIRWGLDGGVKQLLNRYEHFDPPVHHEVTRKNGLTYVLFAEETIVGADSFVTDGFLVFDDTGATVGTWHLSDHVVPVEDGTAVGGYWGDSFPGATDWSHSNALAVDDELKVTVSLRFQDALIRVVGDPYAADFGEVVWIVAGDASSSLTTTVPYGSSMGIADLGFQEQHHVVSSAAGELTLWDNGLDPAVGSRVIRFAADDSQLDLVQEWPVGAYCPGQGSASLLASGNVLVDCAPADTIAEVDPSGATVWSARAVCSSGLMLRPLYRGLPLALQPVAP